MREPPGIVARQPRTAEARSTPIAVRGNLTHLTQFDHLPASKPFLLVTCSSSTVTRALSTATADTGSASLSWRKQGHKLAQLSLPRSPKFLLLRNQAYDCVAFAQLRAAGADH